MTQSEDNARQLDRARRALFGTGSRFGAFMRRTGARRMSPSLQV